MPTRRRACSWQVLLVALVVADLLMVSAAALDDDAAYLGHYKDLGGDESGSPADTDADDLAEAGETSAQVGPVKLEGIQVFATIFVGQTSVRKFDAEFEKLFVESISSVAQVPSSSVKVVKLEAVAQSKTAKPVVGRRLAAAPINSQSSSDGVKCKLIISGMKTKPHALAISSALEQGCQGGTNSQIASVFKKLLPKHPTVHSKIEPNIKMEGHPLIIGSLPTAPAASCKKPNGCTPKWCKKKKLQWKSHQCAPSFGTYRKSLKRMDEIICVCNGIKVVQRPQDIDTPDWQTASIIRAHATERTYQAYSFQVKAPRSSARPNTEGIQYHMEFEHQTGKGHKDGKHKIVRKHIKIQFNRIFEFANHDGYGLKDESTHRLDPVSKAELQGIPCDDGRDTNAANPGKNCMLQHFFLDTFQPSAITDEGTLKRISFTSDVQGTSPWCTKAKGACANPPKLKPRVTFDFGADVLDFSHAKMNITIDHFPYKFKNSSLALRAKVFALSTETSIDPGDMLAKPTFLDKLNCNAQPLPGGCPKFLVDKDVTLSWAKQVTSVEDKQYKIITTSPSHAAPSDSKLDRLGNQLSSDNTYFSFKHGGSVHLRWDPKTSMHNLPPTQIGASVVVRPLATTLMIVVFAGIFQVLQGGR